MKTRDDYVARLKADLDRWNADAARWEAQAGKVHAELRKGCEKQLKAVRARREEALYQLKLLEGASTSAWTELERGADEARARMREALDAAKSYFEKAAPVK